MTGEGSGGRGVRDDRGRVGGGGGGAGGSESLSLMVIVRSAPFPVIVRTTPPLSF